MGGSRGEAPSLGIWTPPNTPPLKLLPPPLNHFWVGLPYLKNFDSPTSEILTPLPEKFWILQKRSHSPSSNLVTPPLRIFWVWLPYLKIFDSPTWKILNFEPHSDSPSSILGTPPLRISELDSPTSKILTPLVEKFWNCKKGPNPLVQFWRLPPSGFLSWTPLPQNFWLPYLRNFILVKKVRLP